MASGVHYEGELEVVTGETKRRPVSASTVGAFRERASDELVKRGSSLGHFRLSTLDNALKALHAELTATGRSARVGVGERRLGRERAHARHGEREAQHGNRSRYG